MTRIISFYGDDFTGSTDVMEALASHGIKTILFTRMPSSAEFAPYKHYQGVGLAGTSRSQSPSWMRENLPAIFNWLRSLDARFCHYKVCSTFDSAPHVGSIGCATELGAEIFSQPMVPMVVGAPQLKRFTFAGHLFAAYQGEIFRIDRHPVMSRHPVTPMHESDLRSHLGQQTKLPVTCVTTDWPSNGVGLVDVFDTATQIAAGEKLLQWKGGFVAGSSGVEYALMKALTKSGTIPGTAEFEPLEPVQQVVVASGSVSPTTERQIRNALQNGFVAVPVDAVELAKSNLSSEQSAISAALAVLDEGKSPLIHTALGPSSDQGKILLNIKNGRQAIGEALGRMLKAVVEARGLKRAILAGGDSSSHALGQLDIFALETRMPMPATPGSPLCRASSGHVTLDGLELALKGGQVGGDDYFSVLRDGNL